MFRYFVKNSFKSHVAAEHVCSEVPARNQSQKTTRRRLREQERRTAKQAASAAILTFFTELCLSPTRFLYFCVGNL